MRRKASSLITQANPIWAHLLAGGLACGYAAWLSSTQYVQTGLQFVFPFLLILGAHLLLSRGRAERALARSCGTATLLLVLMTAGHLLAPMPAQANDALGSFLGILACVAMLCVVLAILGAVVWVVYRLCKAALAKLRGPGKDDRANEGASLAVVLALLAAMSLEGLSWAYSFDGQAEAQVTVSVDAPRDTVWHAMQTATSPAAPLPGLLRAFPQPVAVLVDEGTVLGARREVLFRGREGEGTLQLKVTEASLTHARFDTLSNSSPIAGWIDLQSLTYTLKPAGTPAGEATQLTVSLGYDRLLAPAWAFDPIMKAACSVAMAVLAKDVQRRAQALAGLAQTR